MRKLERELKQLQASIETLVLPNQQWHGSRNEVAIGMCVSKGFPDLVEKNQGVLVVRDQEVLFDAMVGGKADEIELEVQGDAHMVKDCGKLEWLDLC